VLAWSVLRELVTYGLNIGDKMDELNKIIRRISERTGKDAKEILAEINKRHEELKFLAIEVVALIVAKELGVDVKDLIDEVEELIIKRA